MEIDYCFHTHTFRCGHAQGLDEEYVLEAIKNGIKVLGFSDHVMIPNFKDKGELYNPSIRKHGVRGDYDVFFNDYIDSINKLKEKYKDIIEIHLGFEAEYAIEYENYYRSLLDSKKIEYLIQGQHFHSFDGNFVHYSSLDFEKAIEIYIDDVIQGMSSGLFKYLAHPDIFSLWYGSNEPRYEEFSRRIIESAIKYDIPLEINLGGRRRREDESHLYANRKFFEIVGEYKNNKVIIGCDAHNPLELSKSDIKYAKKLIADYKLNEITRIL